MTQELGDQPIEQIHAKLMTGIASFLDEELNGDLKGEARLYGFCLMVFQFGDEHKGRVNYISNARRQDVIRLLRDQLAKFEKDQR